MALSALIMQNIMDFAASIKIKLFKWALMLKKLNKYMPYAVCRD